MVLGPPHSDALVSMSTPPRPELDLATIGNTRPSIDDTIPIEPPRADAQQSTPSATAAEGAASSPSPSATRAASSTPQDVHVARVQGSLGIPGVVLDAYQTAAETSREADPTCRMRWQVLAGIGKIETGHARGGRVDVDGQADRILGPVLNGSGPVAAIRDTDDGRWDAHTEWDRAVGPMQFIPGTFETHGVDGTDHRDTDPNNGYDAATTSARYLCLSGADMSDDDDLAQALRRYNNSTTYVADVLAWIEAYDNGEEQPTDTPGRTGEDDADKPTPEPEPDPTETEEPDPTDEPDPAPSRTPSDPDKPQPDPTDPDEPSPDPTDPDEPSPDPTDPDEPSPDPTDPDEPSPDPTDPDEPSPEPTDPDAPPPHPTDPEQPPPDPTDPEEPSPDPSSSTPTPGENLNLD